MSTCRLCPLRQRCPRVRTAAALGYCQEACIWALIAAAVVMLLMLPAHARDLGQWTQADPIIRDWIKELRDKTGIACCDTADGHEVDGWSFQRPPELPAYFHPAHQGYWVKVQGQWLPVPAKALLEMPNKLGYARVWLVYESGQPIVRCFIAGAGG